MAEVDDRDRRDERTVEIAFALVLGVGTFLGLVLAGWVLDRALRAWTSTSLEPIAPGAIVAAAVVALGVVVWHLVRARRRGL